MDHKNGLTTGAVGELAGHLDGRLLRPDNEGYDEARTIQNAAYNRSPAVIVQAADAADVITAVNFARDHNATLAIKSGGHSLPGHSTSDSMVLDLSRMKAMSVDPDRRTVRVESGATWGEVSEALQVYGLAVPSGDSASVGVGGLTMGGGIGWLVRKYGLTIDSLLSVDIVTADGRLLTASSQVNPDLFWAVRGGGGNFGIATSFEFQAHPVGMIVGGAIVYDAAEGKEVLRRYIAHATEAPDELSTILNIMHAPPLPFIPPEMHGRLVIAIAVCYAGDLEEGQRVVAPLRSLGTPVADVVGPMPYPAIYALTQDATVKGFHHDWRSMFARELDDEALDTILQHSNAMRSPLAIAQLRVLGGAMARVPSAATAFSHRDKRFMFTAINLWLDPRESEEQRAWTERFWQDLRPHAHGVYMNFLGDEGEERIREAYSPATYRRLATLKARYDPTNFFHLNQNIKPAIRHEERSAA